jgi:hypothetical protein
MAQWMHLDVDIIMCYIIKGNLGQPKVNLGQNEVGLPEIQLGATENLIIESP